MKILNSLLMSATALGIAAASTAVQANDFPADSTSYELHSDDIIYVTARKRQESFFETPVTLMMIDREGISDRGVSDIHGLVDHVPNFSMNPSNGRQAERATIRGQSSILGAPNASFFVDGHYVNAESAIATSLLDSLDRVEVIRGPQAALYGRSTLSGAVNYVTRRPSDAAELETRFEAGTYESYQGSITLSGPLSTSRWSGLINLSQVYDGGEWENTLPELAPSGLFPGAPTRADTSQLGEESTTNLFGKLTYDGEAVRASFTGQLSSADDGLYGFYFIGANELNCYLPVAATPTEDSRGYYCGEVNLESRSVSANIPDIEDGLTFAGNSGPGASPGNERETQRFSGELIFDINEWEVITRTSYSDDEHTLAEDSDRTGTRPGLYFFNGTVIEKQTEDFGAELRVNFPKTDVFSGFLGVYYYEQEHRDRRRGHYQDFGALGAADEIENTAYFGAVEITPSESLTIGLEARYAEDEISLGDIASTTFDSFTPRLTFSFQSSSDAYLFGSVAKGTKPGGFNDDFFKSSTHADAKADAIATGRAFIEEEEAISYEIGYKSSNPESGLSFSGTIFYIDWRDQQLTSIAEIEQTDLSIRAVPILVNLGESRVQGIETELAYAPSDDFSFGLSYGLSDTEITVGNDPVDHAALTGFDDPDLLQGGNLKGKQLPNAPRHSAALWGQYETPLTDELSWYVRSDVTFESKKYAQVHNLIHTGDRLKVNFRMGLASNKWELSLFGDNIFDDDTPVTITRYVDFVSPSGPNGRWRGFSVTPQRGARFGVEFKRLFAL